MKHCKTNYYNHYFESKWNDIKNTWKGSKSILTIKNISADIPKSLSVYGTTISNPMAIWNVFKNYFSSIDNKTKLTISFSHKIFSDFLKNRSNVSLFVSPADKTEIENVIFSISFSSGVYPSILRTAKVISVHKNDSKLEFLNSRPISLLTNIQIILKRLMYNSIYKFFNDSNLIYSLQFGFSQKYSKVHALISPTENIKSLDEGSTGFGILLTYKKHLI